MWITSDVDIMRCIASAWEPLPQEKAVVRSYCPAFFRMRACSKTQQRVVVSFSDFYFTEFLFVEMKISVSWYHLLLINIVAVTVLKIPPCAEFFTMAEPKYSPHPQSVQCTRNKRGHGAMRAMEKQLDSIAQHHGAPRTKDGLSSTHAIWKPGPECVTIISFRSSANCLVSYSLPVHG